MFTPIEAFLAWRYTRARRTRFVSLIAGISIAGVTLGVAALITILSIMNGFEREMRQRILGMSPHITVAAADGGLDDWSQLQARLQALSEVTAVAPTVSGEVMLALYDQVQGARVLGILPENEADLSVLPTRMVHGELNALIAGKYKIILGRGLADALRVSVGDKLTLILPAPMRTAAGLVPRLRRFELVGIFEAGVHEYDATVAFVHLADAARLFRLREAVSTLRLHTTEPFRAPEIAAEIQSLLSDLGTGWRVGSWIERNVNLFRALATEKIIMFAILALCVGVAMFNLVSSLVMVVEDKRSEVAVLRTVGMTPARIFVLFVCQGSIIGLTGVLIGVLAGVLLSLHIDTVVAAIEAMFGFQFFPGDVYYISEIPSRLEMTDVFWVALFALGLALLAPLYPARAASRQQPADILRDD